MRSNRNPKRCNHEWESRLDGTKLAIITTCILLCMGYIPLDWCQTLHSYWGFPLPIWALVCLVVYTLGRIFKLIIRFL